MAPESPHRYKNEADAKAAYFEYVIKHKEAIKRAFREYGDKFTDCLGVDINKLRDLISVHDDDKLVVDDEINGFIANFYPYEGDGIPDDAYGLRRAIFEKALLAHYSRNPHHPEYWSFIENNKLDAKAMEPIYVCEMILDWIANETNKGSLPTSQYWRLNRSSKYLHPDTVKMIDIVMDIVSEEEEMERLK